MRHALELVNFPDVGDPLQFVRFAAAAERAAWDGLLAVREWLRSGSS